MSNIQTKYIPRDQLSEDQLREALDHCASEPIHIPGSIQPHGMLVVVSGDNVIEQISANAGDFFGVTAGQCLGKNISEFLSAETIRGLEGIRNAAALQPIQSIIVQLNGVTCDVVSHQSGASTVIELEPIRDLMHPDSFYYDELRNYSIGMHKAKTLHAVFDHVTHYIRLITGFDRVKLYRFDQDWHGEVVAESRAEHMPSYKGLHFPSSDIPEQARRLYMQNYLRLIADTQYKPVPIIPTVNPATLAPLDLSLSMLRSVSPVHIQYLENINIFASMSVSIIQNGKLWGLIACHHSAPLHIPYLVRNVCEIMGHIFSAQLSTMEDFAKREARDKREQLVRRFSSALDKNARIDALMGECNELAMEALDAQGLIIKTYVHVLNYGEVPAGDTVAKLIDWLKSRDESIFYTDDAKSYFKDRPALHGLTGGILAITISNKSHDYIIWRRNPIVEEVTWAGDPEKPVEETVGGYRLTPRSSFALWKQEVSHRSKSWSEEDVRVARSIATVLLEGEKLSAQQANLAKTEFLANMSHEIRTPMNAIIGLSNILAASNPLNDRQREMLRTLKLSADSLLHLINDLLDISKIESRALEIEFIPFDMKKLLQEVISMTSVRALEKGIAFSLDENGPVSKMYVGDPNRIRQILMNLCSNAVKFTEKGGVRVTISMHEATRSDHEKICVAVQDSGIGIAPDKIDAIFHKFVQADSSISRKYGGTGLGLAITKMLVEAMNGEIRVESELGKGSEFTVCFDLKVASEQPKASNDAVFPQIFGSGVQARILLVEDYEPNIMVASNYLEPLGVVCDVARNGWEALRKFDENSYAAILMDVQMPELNGFDTTQMIRQKESVRNQNRTPIIGMTAHALAGDRERCIDAGMDDYIAKPIDEDELKGKILVYSAI